MSHPRIQSYPPFQKSPHPTSDPIPKRVPNICLIKMRRSCCLDEVVKNLYSKIHRRQGTHLPNWLIDSCWAWCMMLVWKGNIVIKHKNANNNGGTSFFFFFHFISLAWGCLGPILTGTWNFKWRNRFVVVMAVSSRIINSPTLENVSSCF